MGLLIVHKCFSDSLLTLETNCLHIINRFPASPVSISKRTIAVETWVGSHEACPFPCLSYHHIACMTAPSACFWFYTTLWSSLCLTNMNVVSLWGPQFTLITLMWLTKCSLSPSALLQGTSFLLCLSVWKVPFVKSLSCFSLLMNIATIIDLIFFD